MKSIWTVGRVQWTHEGKLHPVLLWSLWGTTLSLLGLWLLGMVLGVTMGGWIHLVALLALLIGGLCTVLIFKFGEFLERPFRKRFRRKGDV